MLGALKVIPHLGIDHLLALRPEEKTDAAFGDIGSAADQSLPGFRFGIVAAQMPSSSPVLGFRCASFALSSVAMGLQTASGVSV